jgi:hypothetical protein
MTDTGRCKPPLADDEPNTENMETYIPSTRRSQEESRETGQAKHGKRNRPYAMDKALREIYRVSVP